MYDKNILHSVVVVTATKFIYIMFWEPQLFTSCCVYVYCKVLYCIQILYWILLCLLYIYTNKNGTVLICLVIKLFKQHTKRLMLFYVLFAGTVYHMLPFRPDWIFINYIYVYYLVYLLAVYIISFYWRCCIFLKG